MQRQVTAQLAYMQVKRVVNQQDIAHAEDQAGPLEELRFWQHRGDDLSGICQQLDAPGAHATTTNRIVCRAVFWP